MKWISNSCRYDSFLFLFLIIIKPNLFKNPLMERSNNVSDLIKLCNKIVVSISVNKYPNIWDIANN